MPAKPKTTNNYHRISMAHVYRALMAYGHACFTPVKNNNTLVDVNKKTELIIKPFMMQTGSPVSLITEINEITAWQLI